MAILTETTPKDDQGFFIQRSIEAFSPFNKKSVYGYRIAVRKIVERGEYRFDYGLIRYEKEVYLPKPVRYVHEKCYPQAFELLGVN